MWNNFESRAVWVCASIFVLANTSCGPRLYYVEHLEIDSTLHVHPIGTRSIPEPAQGSYYFFFHGANLISVDHFAKKSLSERRDRLLYLEADLDSLLDRSVKQDEIMKGPYGTLYATKTCFYNRPIEGGASAVSIGSYSNDLGHEVPVELTAAPNNLPPLTSVSVVRIFRASPEYIIASANYEPDGNLGSLHVDKTAGGDWVSGSASVNLGLEQTLLATYGVSRRIDFQQYLSSRRLALSPAALPDVANLLIRFYGYGKMIRQDNLNHGVVIGSRFLQPSITPEEKILDPVCEAHFRQLAAAKLRTVE